MNSQANGHLRVLKEAAPLVSPQRELLGQSFVVLRVTGVSPPPDVSDAALSALWDDAATAVNVWLHIGLMYWNPYRPTFMGVCEVVDPEECDVDPRRRYIRSTGTFYTLWEGMHACRDCLLLRGQLYQLEDGDRPIGRMTPPTRPFAPTGAAA